MVWLVLNYPNNMRKMLVWSPNHPLSVMGHNWISMDCETRENFLTGFTSIWNSWGNFDGFPWDFPFRKPMHFLCLIPRGDDFEDHDHDIFVGVYIYNFWANPWTACLATVAICQSQSMGPLSGWLTSTRVVRMDLNGEENNLCAQHDKDKAITAITISYTWFWSFI